jgi:2'-5' RNA ligase
VDEKLGSDFFKSPQFLISMVWYNFGMTYYLIISPKALEETLISESKRLMKDVYGKNVENIYYRVKTTDKLENPRKLFIKGDGRIVEAEYKPHISVIHDIETNNINDFIEKVKIMCAKYSSINLMFDDVGNYGMDFTFFIGFKNNPELDKLRWELLELSKPYIPEEKYQHYLQVSYIPHATVIYDDVNPEKVDKAFKLFDKTKFEKPIIVTEIELWMVDGQNQETIAKIPLAIK